MNWKNQTISMVALVKIFVNIIKTWLSRVAKQSLTLAISND